MRIFDHVFEIAFIIVLIVLLTLFAIVVYKGSSRQSELEILTKYLITKDSLITVAKIDSIKNRRIKK